MQSHRLIVAYRASARRTDEEAMNETMDREAWISGRATSRASTAYFWLWTGRHSPNGCRVDDYGRKDANAPQYV